MRGKWRPIETAPFDGTRVLIFGETKKAGWVAMTARFSKEFGGHWVTTEATGQSCGIEHVCTARAASHWMPLPADPERR